MKKQTLLILVVSLGASLSYGNAFKGEDFNQMIQDNQKAEADLRARLQKEAGIELNADKPGSIAKEKIMAPTEAEQIVVSSSQSLWTEKKDRSAKKLYKAEMKRLSQELDEAAGE
ncbi:MAG: hypothetical protein ACAH59_10235 [Pseudobdellovibrionaceae bacterium]